jgi:hypothetical protein
MARRNQSGSVARRAPFRTSAGDRYGPRRHSRLVAKPVPSWARQVHMAGPCHSWKARWAVGVGPGKAVASTSALERESPNRPLLPDRVIPIRLTATEDVANWLPFRCLPAVTARRPPPAARRPPPPCRKAERNREPATVQQKVSEDGVKCSRNFMTKLLGVSCSGTRQSKHQSFR